MTPTPTPVSVSLPLAGYQDRFTTALAQMNESPPTAGPLAGALVEATVGTVPFVVVDQSLTNFMAEAMYTNPAAAPVLADAGFRFHVGEANSDVILDSRGDIYVAVQDINTEFLGRANAYDPAVGATNTLQLVVEDGIGLFGVNGELAAAFDLGTATPAGDVRFGSAFFASDFLQDRVTDYQGFRVWDLTAPAAPTNTPVPPTNTPTPTPTLTPTPVPALPLADFEAPFAAALAAMSDSNPTAGPASGTLVEATAGEVALTGFDLTLTEFMTAVTFTNPDTTAGLSDAGFRVHLQAGIRNDVVLDSLGDIYVIPRGGSSQRIGHANAYDAAPGARNTLQLIVDGQIALFGVNGTLAAAVDLGSNVVPGDVRFGVGFYTEDFVQDRVTTYEDFRIWDLAAPAAPTSTPSPTSTPIPPTSTPSPSPIVSPTPVPEPLDLPIADYQDLFASSLAQIASEPPVAGPLQGSLVDTSIDSVPLASAGANLANFIVTATFINPDTSAAVASMGFQFRQDGPLHNRITINTNRGISAIPPGMGAQFIVTAAGFDPAAGARNTLLLIVDGDVALVGVNGELAATIRLTSPPVVSDVSVGTSFYSDNFVQDRVTEYEDFRVWAIDETTLPGTPSATSTPRPTSTPVHTFAPLRTATPVPTSAPPLTSTPLPTSTPALAIGATEPALDDGAAELARLIEQAQSQPSIAGPDSGEILLDAESVNFELANVNVQDFFTHATFTNPYPASDHDWDFGFAFRHSGVDDEFRLIITSEGAWHLGDGPNPPIASGEFAGLETAANETNHIDLVAFGDVGYFSINGEFISSLDLSDRTQSGDIGVSSGFFVGYKIDGRSTPYEDFEVWSLDDDDEPAA
jgi:hypothetical protein